MPECVMLFRNLLEHELRRRSELIEQRVNNISEEQFLVATTEELTNYVAEGFSRVPLKLQEPQLARRELQRALCGGIVTDCYGLVVSIPFEGSSELWQLRPSRHRPTYPEGEVVTQEGASGGDLRFEILCPANEDNNRIEKKIKERLEMINYYINEQAADVHEWNESLFRTAEAHINARKGLIMKLDNLIEMIGIPLARRLDTPFLPVSMPRGLARPLPPVPVQGYQPEPGILEEEYRYILNVIRHEMRTFEAMRGTAQKLEEEDFRNILLSHLNGHYYGGATGETFRGAGKTDICIEDNNRCAFVAECKIWHGASGLTRAIDQLLGYLTWRDCKTGLLIFNKDNKNLSGIADQVHGCFEGHREFRRSEICDPENCEWEYSMASPRDDGRTLKIHAFLFDFFNPLSVSDGKSE